MFKVGDKVRAKAGKSESNTSRKYDVLEGFTYTVSQFGCTGLGFHETEVTGYSPTRFELVSNSPVRETTVVKKEVVPGTYGKVRILALSDTKRVHVEFYQSLNKTQLAEVIKTLQLIHDAME